MSPVWLSGLAAVALVALAALVAGLSGGAGAACAVVAIGAIVVIGWHLRTSTACCVGQRGRSMRRSPKAEAPGAASLPRSIGGCACARRGSAT